MKIKACAPAVIAVKPEPGYKLRLKFANGKVKRYDMSRRLTHGVLRELRDPKLFASARVWEGTVRWANRADACPETLYEEGIAV